MIIISRIAEAKPRVYKCSLCYLATEMVRSALRANQQLFEKSPCHISTKAGPFRAVVLRRRSNPQVLWSDIDFVAADQRQKVFHGKGGRKRERENHGFGLSRVVESWKKAADFTRLQIPSNYRGTSRKFPTWSFVFFFLQRSSSFFNSVEFFFNDIVKSEDWELSNVPSIM